MLGEKGPLCAGDLFRYARITFHEPGSICSDVSKMSDHCPHFITVAWQWFTIHASLKKAVDPILNCQYLVRAGDVLRIDGGNSCQ